MPVQICAHAHTCGYTNLEETWEVRKKKKKGGSVISGFLCAAKHPNNQITCEGLKRGPSKLIKPAVRTAAEIITSIANIDGSRRQRKLTWAMLILGGSGSCMMQHFDWQWKMFYFWRFLPAIHISRHKPKHIHTLSHTHTHTHTHTLCSKHKKNKDAPAMWSEETTNHIETFVLG